MVSPGRAHANNCDAAPRRRAWNAALRKDPGLMKEDNIRAHSTEGDSWTRWAHDIRRIELEGALNDIPLAGNSTVLELGCGDGFQLSLLRERFAYVFAIDPVNMPDQARGCAYAVAEALPFGSEAFDLIVSNCVLEHLNDRRRALDECARVLKPGGFMAHVVPSRLWKVASLLLNPIGYPLRIAEKWWATQPVVRGGGGRFQTHPDALPIRGRLLARSSVVGPARPSTGPIPGTSQNSGPTGVSTGQNRLSTRNLSICLTNPLFAPLNLVSCGFALFQPAGGWAGTVLTVLVSSSCIS